LYFRGAECTTGNLMRLRPGSNRLHVVWKPKYCCRVCSKCSGRVVNVSIHWQVSLWKAKRLQLIWSTEQKGTILWRFYNYNGSCLPLEWEDTFEMKVNLFSSMLSGFLLFHINCQHELQKEKKEIFFIHDNFSEVYEVLGILLY